MESLYCAPCTLRGVDDREAYTIHDGQAKCFPCMLVTVEQIQRDRGVKEHRDEMMAQMGKQP